MSFRHTFITDYIYCASEEVLASNAEVKKVFEDEMRWKLDHWVGDDGWGYYAGWFKTLDPFEYTGIREVAQTVRKLSEATKVPFRLTVMVEDLDLVTTYFIEPNHE